MKNEDKKKVILKKWRKRLQKGVRHGEFTEEDKSKAGTWTCCAVGERDKLCKRLIGEKNFYHDDIFVKHTFGLNIYGLGVRFSSAITQDDFVKALDIIEQIEKLEVKKFYK